jgi:hypothetical protein
MQGAGPKLFGNSVFRGAKPENRCCKDACLAADPSFQLSRAIFAPFFCVLGSVWFRCEYESLSHRLIDPVTHANVTETARSRATLTP